MELWELSARESIRDAIVQYAHAGDRLMVEEMAAVFCLDGVLETPRDQGTYVGREAIVQRLAGGRGTTNAEVRSSARAERRVGETVIRRHVVSNVRFETLTPEQATVTSYFTVLTNNGLDHFGRYRDVFVPVAQRWLIKHRLVLRDWQRAEPTDPVV